MIDVHSKFKYPKMCLVTRTHYVTQKVELIIGCWLEHIHNGDTYRAKYVKAFIVDEFDILQLQALHKCIEDEVAMVLANFTVENTRTWSKVINMNTGAAWGMPIDEPKTVEDAVTKSLIMKIK